MKVIKSKSDTKSSKKSIKRSVKKDLQGAIAEKIAEAMKNCGLAEKKVEKYLKKASKRLTKKLFKEVKGLNHELMTKAKSTGDVFSKLKQTSLSEAQKVVDRVLKAASAKPKTPRIAKREALPLIRAAKPKATPAAKKKVVNKQATPAAKTNTKAPAAKSPKPAAKTSTKAPATKTAKTT